MPNYEFVFITLGVPSVTPNRIFVAPPREFLKYVMCSMILEVCNKTLHMVLLNSTGSNVVTLLG